MDLFIPLLIACAMLALLCSSLLQPEQSTEEQVFEKAGAS